MFRFNYDVAKILQSGFIEGLVFGCALGVPAMAMVFLAYWIF